MAAWRRSVPSIFISYRRQDAEVFAGRLYDKLVQEFGENRVFMDVDTLKPGDDYIKAIEKKLRHIDVFLTVIGKQWVTVTDERGSPRLDDERDLLRLEVATALKRGIRVIPVLVGDAAMPRVADLPGDIANISRLHAFELTSARFRSDVQLLVNTLRGSEGGPGRGVKPVTNWSWLGVLAGIQPAFFWVAGGMLHLQAETREYLYPSAQWVFFGGLTVGGALAALGWRSRNSPAVFQGAAQLVVGTGAALSLSAIDELLARNVAFGLYFVAALFTAAAWWTIRYVPHPPAGRRATATSDAAPADGIVEGDEADRDSAAPTPAADEEQSRARHRVGSDRVKRTSSYLLVSIDVLGLLLFVLGTVILWDAHPQRTDSSPVLLGMLMMVPATLALILFGWIAEVRLCWMLGLATVVPMLLLVLAETTRGARPLALAAIAGVGVAAFAVETLRRLRRNSVPHRGVRGEPPEPAPVSAPARQP